MIRKLKFRDVSNSAKVTQLSEWQGLELNSGLSLQSLLWPQLHDTSMEKMQLEVK